MRGTAGRIRTLFCALETLSAEVLEDIASPCGLEMGLHKLSSGAHLVKEWSYMRQPGRRRGEEESD